MKRSEPSKQRLKQQRFSLSAITLQPYLKNVIGLVSEDDLTFR